VSGFDLHLASWQDRGDRLVLGNGAGTVWLLRPSRGGDLRRLTAEIRAALEGGGLPPPWDVRARNAVESVRLFSEAGWLAATTEWTGTRDTGVVLWFRRSDGTWDEPLVFAPRDLLLPEGLFLGGAVFSADGQQAVLAGQHLVLSTQRLLTIARALSRGESTRPRDAARATGAR
jgi:hypothetical protein